MRIRRGAVATDQAVKLDRETFERLSAWAEDENCATADLIREALDDFFKANRSGGVP